MRATRLFITIGTAASAAAVIAAPGTSASGKFKGDVCKLLGAKQVLAVHVTTNCTQQKTATSSQGTVMTAVWGVNKPIGPRLSVGIFVPASSQFLTILKTSYKRGKPVGIGDWSRDDGLGNGGTADGISFAKGKYFVTISLTTKFDKPLKTSAPLVAAAKAIAGQL
jgi:hypothetical protein